MVLEESTKGAFVRVVLLPLLARIGSARLKYGIFINQA